MEKELDRIVCERLTQLLAVAGGQMGVGEASRGTGKMLCGHWVGGEQGDRSSSSGGGSHARSPDGLQRKGWQNLSGEWLWEVRTDGKRGEPGFPLEPLSRGQPCLVPCQ